MSRKWVLICIVLILIILLGPLLFMQSDFTGVDAQIGDTLKTVNGNYTPWKLFEGKKLSGEMETFLFSFQSGIGAGVVGYILGFVKGRKHERDKGKNRRGDTDVRENDVREKN